MHDRRLHYLLHSHQKPTEKTGTQKSPETTNNETNDNNNKKRYVNNYGNITRLKISTICSTPRKMKNNHKQKIIHLCAPTFLYTALHWNNK